MAEYEFEWWAPSPSPAVGPSPPSTPSWKVFLGFSPPLIAMVAVIGVAFLIVIYARIVSRHLRRLRRRFRRRRLHPPPPPPSGSFSSSDYPHQFPPYGLDDPAIKSLPLTHFAKSSSPVMKDCAVCLLDFDDGDPVRTLHLCAHAFHVDCIDAWLRAHATCPLCRAAVFPQFVPMRAARIRPSMDDLLLLDSTPDPPEIEPAEPELDRPRNFLLNRSYSFGFERTDRILLEASTASPWRYRNRSFWSKRWPSPFGGGGGGGSTSRAARAFSFRSYRGGKSPFYRRRGFFTLSSERVGVGLGLGMGIGSGRRTRSMTSPTAMFMRGSSRMRCGDPEALLSPERLNRR